MCSSFTIATSQDLAPYTTYFQFAVIKVADLLWNQSVIIKIMGLDSRKGQKQLLTIYTCIVPMFAAEITEK